MSDEIYGGLVWCDVHGHMEPVPGCVTGRPQSLLSDRQRCRTCGFRHHNLREFNTNEGCWNLEWHHLEAKLEDQIRSLKREVAAWEKGVRDANAISQRERIRAEAAEARVKQLEDMLSEI